jgi:hypothetical protein
MLEGSIEMRVNGRSLPITVSQGEQLLLYSDIADPDSADHAPASSPAATQARLIQQAQSLLVATGNITIPPTAALSGSDGNSLPVQPDTPDKQPEEPAAPGLFPAPDAQPNAPRLSPTDGIGSR